MVVDQCVEYYICPALHMAHSAATIQYCLLKAIPSVEVKEEQRCVMSDLTISSMIGFPIQSRLISVSELLD